MVIINTDNSLKSSGEYTSNNKEISCSSEGKNYTQILLPTERTEIEQKLSKLKEKKEKINNNRKCEGAALGTALTAIAAFTVLTAIFCPWALIALPVVIIATMLFLHPFISTKQDREEDSEKLIHYETRIKALETQLGLTKT